MIFQYLGNTSINVHQTRREPGRERVYKRERERERERESLLTSHDPLVENEKVRENYGTLSHLRQLPKFSHSRSSMDKDQITILPPLIA